ncbi:hypothetical protein BGY98DRAFT_944529, partial [Russula aff. rugulosa BPL654]
MAFPSRKESDRIDDPSQIPVCTLPDDFYPYSTIQKKVQVEFPSISHHRKSFHSRKTDVSLQKFRNHSQS